MNQNKNQTILKDNGIFYLISFLVLLAMKYFYSRADASALKWILAPTVWWVQAFSRIPFHYVPYEGYVNHTYQFVIAPSCSGMQFMIITIATLLFPFIHQFESIQKKVCWMIFTLPASYILTILVNIIRIIVSIYLPVILEQKSLLRGSLTPARLHTLIGTFVYFTFLVIIYYLAGLLTHRSFHKFLPPLFFYLALVLGVPFLNRAWQNGSSQFSEYAILVLIVCLTVLSSCKLMHILRRMISKNLSRLLHLLSSFFRKHPLSLKQ